MDLIDELLAQGSLSKPLSAFYLALLSVDSPKMERLWGLWKADLPDLDREDCLEDSTKLLIFSQDELIHIKFLNRVYYAQNLPSGVTRMP